MMPIAGNPAINYIGGADLYALQFFNFFLKLGSERSWARQRLPQRSTISSHQLGNGLVDVLGTIRPRGNAKLCIMARI